MKPADEEAFRSFLAARSAALLRFAHALTADYGRAEDLLQESLARTYVAWPRIRDPQAAEGYVRTTMSRTAISWSRRRWWNERPTEHLPDRPGIDPDESFSERDALDPGAAAALAAPAGGARTAVLRGPVV